MSEVRNQRAGVRDIIISRGGRGFRCRESKDKMKHIKRHLLAYLMSAVAVVLGVVVFSTLIYQYDRSREDLIEIATKEAHVVLQTVIVGIQTTSGIRKRLEDAHVATNIIRQIMHEHGTGALLQKLGVSGSIHYLVCQDEDQIVAASKGVKELSSIWADPFLRGTFEKGKSDSRLLAGRRYYFESVCPFTVEGKRYLLRICFKMSSIRRLELHLIRRLALQGGVFAFVIFLLALYFFNVHSTRLIARERDTITTEVERIQQHLRQEERTAAMGRLAAGIAHEIRNPLNAIQILVQRLERETAPADETASKFRQFTRVIREELKRLNDIVRQFLHFASAKEPSFRQCDPAGLVNDIVCLEHGVAGQRGVTLKEELDGKLRKFETDPQQLKQALMNVVQNALEGTPEGGDITIRVAQDDGWTDFTVEDNGRGMSDEEREKAFDLYYSTKDHGTGLGLAITRRIVDRLGGEITLSQRDPQGTTVTIRIPNRRNDEHPVD